MILLHRRIDSIILLVFIGAVLDCRIHSFLVHAFVPPCVRTKQHQHVFITQKYLAKNGGNLPSKSRSKQAELRRKLEQARQQKQTDVSQSAVVSEQEIRERNDRLRFEQLLRTDSFKAFNDYSSDGYLNKRQETEEINAALSSAKHARLFEGDPAPTDCFAELVSTLTGNAISSKGAKRLVPWLGKSSSNNNNIDNSDNSVNDDYLVVLCDPRLKSTELRQSVRMILSDVPTTILSRLVIINADSPAENRRWIKKNKLENNNNNDNDTFGSASTSSSSSPIRVSSMLYSDEKMEWMRAYTALGEKRWSMTVMVLAKQRVQKLAREVDLYGIVRTIEKAVQSYQSDN